MHVTFDYKKNEKYGKRNVIEIYANDVPMGELETYNYEEGKTLHWFPILEKDALRFALKDEKVTELLIKELVRYKNDNGCIHLSISASRHGIGPLLGEERLLKLGFKPRPDGFPEYILE